MTVEGLGMLAAASPSASPSCTPPRSVPAGAAAARPVPFNIVITVGLTVPADGDINPYGVAVDPFRVAHWYAVTRS